MKKRALILTSTLLAIISLNGCTKSVSLTEKESDMVAEYIAGVVLGNEIGYKEALVTPTLVPTLTPIPTDSKVPTTVPKEEQNGTTNNSQNSNGNYQANADFTEVIGIDGLKVEYEKYEIRDNIMDSKNTNLEGEGQDLLVISFKLTNETNKEISVKLQNSKIQYQLDINTKNMYKPLFTILDNDLCLLNTTIEAKGNATAIVVFRIKKDLNIENANLIISKDTKTAIIKLK